jgi:DNA-binding SARP family transcriptional activator
MLLQDLLLRTKLSPPRLHRRVLHRPDLSAKLREALDYRLTLVQAGTGYGKTTALATLDTSDALLCWYSVGEADTDPQRFLSYLIAAFSLRLPHLSQAPLAALQEASSGAGPATLTLTLDALVNALDNVLSEPCLLILDDYHFVAGSPQANSLVERFITYAPADLHTVLAARHPFNFSSLVTWRAKGQVLEIGRRELAFRPLEIETLFRDTYGMQLGQDEVAVLADKTEGWPIALQLVWQGLRNSSTQSATVLIDATRDPTSLGTLFDYLAREVIDRQPPEIAAFMRDTAVLRELTPAACDAITGSTDSAAMLDRLHDLDLFVVALGEPPLGSGGERHYRYHHLFQDFLRQQWAADPVGARDTHRAHRRAAEFFQARADLEEAIYHWLAAQAFPEAAAAIELAGEATLRAGRLDTIAQWIDALTPTVLAEYPLLQAYQGDVYRLRSRFDDALAWYSAAEQTWRARCDPVGISRALRGQALVYLDTVRPAQAESLLEEALRLSDGIADRDARARLLELVAENKLNMGKPNEAEAARAQARALREEGPAEDMLSVRVQVRTGRLDEARRILEAWAESERTEVERGQVHTPRAHRETVLLLSLIQSLRGQPELASTLAQDGIALGERLGSPFITAVGHMRLGHAWQLRRLPFSPLLPGEGAGERSREEAIRCYETAIALGDRLAVRRVRVEAMWGLTRAYGFLGEGDLQSAQRAAAEGIETGRWAGDPWVVALVELALGASYVLAGRPEEALEILLRVLRAFRECGDSLGRAATRLWLSLAYLDLRQREHLASCVEDLLALCEAHGYDFLFTAPTLSGPPDLRRLVPILLQARELRCRPAYVERLLEEIGLPDIQVHPGYLLRVQTLGEFRVWRGQVKVVPRDWQRDKARQLFQLLLAQRGRWLQRDEIVETLWPNLSPEAAARDFKVALNAVNKAIEPARLSDAPFAFIVREGTAYRLRPEADVWQDSIAFERECKAGLQLMESGSLSRAIRHLQTALDLYQGDYLPDALYEDWASDERERLLSLYLHAADKLAGALIERGQYEAGLKVCQAILARDTCWENAYRLMIVAHIQQGNRSQALRTFQRCESTLRKENGLSPSPATVALYEQIVQADEAAVRRATSL